MTVQRVFVKRGFWNGKTLEGVTLTLVKGIRMMKDGPSIRVNGEGYIGYPQRNFFVALPAKNPESYIEVYTEGEVGFHTKANTEDKQNDAPFASRVDEQLSERARAIVHETNEEILARINETFEVVQDLAGDVADGILRGLYIYGSPGLGKSYEVEAALRAKRAYNKAEVEALVQAEMKIFADNFYEQLRNTPQDNDDNEEEGKKKKKKELPTPDYPERSVLLDRILRKHYQTDLAPDQPLHKYFLYTIHKGYLSAAELYAMLYDHRGPNDTLVFDDADKALQDKDCVSLMKSALDTTADRIIRWAVVDRRDHLPTHYKFEGNIIVISNSNLDELAQKPGEVGKHLAAIRDRCVTLHVDISSTREKLVRIDSVCKEKQMIRNILSSGSQPMAEDDIDETATMLLEWIHTNASRFKDLSLRQVHHLANLRKSGGNWIRKAELTLLTRDR